MKLEYDQEKIYEYAEQVLQLEAVACKDWLTNKVDRSVTGRIAKQQCAGPLQLPLNNLGAIALDYRGKTAWPLSIGHAPAAGLIDPAGRFGAFHCRSADQHNLGTAFSKAQKCFPVSQLDVALQKSRRRCKALFSC